MKVVLYLNEANRGKEFSREKFTVPKSLPATNKERSVREALLSQMRNFTEISFGIEPEEMNDDPLLNDSDVVYIYSLASILICGTHSNWHPFERSSSSEIDLLIKCSMIAWILKRDR